MNCRHLTPEERQTVAKIFDDAGAPEVIRVIGSLVADRCGLDQLRASLFRAARELQDSIERNGC